MQMVGLAQGVPRGQGGVWADVPGQLYGGHGLERDWTQGPLPAPATGRKGTDVCPEDGASN